MEKIKFICAALMAICAALMVSCSKEKVYDAAGEDGQYVVTINNPVTRALDDQIQGGGKYSDGETVSLFTTALKFTAEASGSAGGKWLSDDPQSRVTLTSGINQDWSVTIKDYYCDVTFDNKATGGDGSLKTETMKFGERLPTPQASSGYNFKGWYDEKDVNITIVPNSSKKTLTGKYELSIIDNLFYLSDEMATQPGRLGRYGYIEYGEGSFWIVVYSQYPLASDINSSLTIALDKWWSDREGGGNLFTDTSTFNKLLKKGEKRWDYDVPLTYEIGIQTPGTKQTWGIQNLRWWWKTDKAGDSWTDSKYNYIITPLEEDYPNFKVTEPNW